MLCIHRIQHATIDLVSCTDLSCAFVPHLELELLGEDDFMWHAVKAQNKESLAHAS